MADYSHQLRFLTGGQKMLVRKEVKALDGLLQADEEVLLISNGLYEKKNGAVIATNRRVLFLDKGLVGLTHEDFPYDRISSVQHQTGMMLGSMKIHASGNEAEIKSMGKEAAKNMAEIVRGKLAEKQASPPAASSESVASQIKTLAELRDAGALTEDEFAAQKARLLG